MKKILITAVAAMALAVVLAPVSEAGILTYTWRGSSGAGAGSCATFARDNAYDLGGQTAELAYWVQSPGGSIESNHSCDALGGLAYSSGNPNWTVATQATGVDGNLAGCRLAGTCNATVDTANIDTSPNPGTAGNSFLRATIFALNAVNGATGYDAGDIDTATAAGTVMHIQYFSATLTGTAWTVTKLNAADWTAHAAVHPQQAGSAFLADTLAGAPNDSCMQLVFTSAIMPDPVTVFDTFTGATNDGAAAKRGVRIYRAPGDPATVTQADFAPVPVGGANARSRVTGLAPVGNPGRTIQWGWAGSVLNNDDYSGWTSGTTFYFNDYNAQTVYQQPETTQYSYIAVPVFRADGGNTDGVPAYFRGSWLNPGSNGGVGSGLITTPATVTAFDASFDPRTGKVTLNWTTTDESGLQGYNVWRELRMGDKLLGQRVKVGFVPAQLGAGNNAYSLPDQPDLSAYLRLARGKPITASYVLETVNDDGTSDWPSNGAASVTMSGKNVQRTGR